MRGITFHYVVLSVGLFLTLFYGLYNTFLFKVNDQNCEIPVPFKTKFIICKVRGLIRSKRGKTNETWGFPVGKLGSTKLPVMVS